MPQVVDAPFARQFPERLHGAANAHDADAVAALCSTVVWEDPAAQITLHGRDALQRLHGDILFAALADTRIELIWRPESRRCRMK